jgi:acetolactate synthase-1/2/3 large subunit
MLDLKLLGAAKETMAGGEAIARMLRAEGVEKVFGIIDGTYFGLYASFRKLGIELITPRHETSAAHMAGAYARLTGRLGVCMASNGPGVANVLPGIAVEQAEGNRVLLITSARRSGTIDPDRGGTYQSFPQVEVTAPMVKWSCRVPSAERLLEIVRRALRVSFSGRPGVVHLDVPESILNGKMELAEGAFWRPAQYRATEPLVPAQALVERAADLLVAAERPLIHAGSGVLHARASAELARVAEFLHAPVTTSWAARGATSERASYALPMIYVDLYRKVRNEADLVLVLGSRLGETDFWGKPPYWRSSAEQRLIQVDIDQELFGNNRPADLAIAGCAKIFLRALAAALEARAGRIDIAARRAWLAELVEARAAARARLDEKLADRTSAPMCTAHVGAICRKKFRDDAIAVFDGGNASIWAHFYHEVRAPDSLLWTPKFGMLGAGVAQALGAKVAFPDRQVYCVTGDGAMGFHPQEIETAVRHGLAVVYLVVCDRQWGMVKMNQQFALRPIKTLVFGSLGPEETINADLGEIRFDELARAMGAHGERASDPAGLEAAIERCLAAARPAVIHVDVDPVKHMWAPGLKHFKDMHAEPGGDYVGSC